MVLADSDGTGSRPDKSSDAPTRQPATTTARARQIRTTACAPTRRPNARVCSGETDGSGVVALVDADGDGICDNDEIEGCDDPEACNFDPIATDNDGSCEYQDALGVCGRFCPSDMDNDGICDDEDACVGHMMPSENAMETVPQTSIRTTSATTSIPAWAATTPGRMQRRLRGRFG